MAIDLSVWKAEQAAALDAETVEVDATIRTRLGQLDTARANVGSLEQAISRLELRKAKIAAVRSAMESNIEEGD
jgi:hypothetical protein